MDIVVRCILHNGYLLNKRTNYSVVYGFEWYMGLNVKRRHRGLGIQQLRQRDLTEHAILMFLYGNSNILEKTEFLIPKIRKERKQRPPTLAERDDYEKIIKHGPQMFSIRQMSRILKLNRITVTKSVKRLKDSGQLLERKGPRDSRIFCPVDCESAKWVYDNDMRSLMDQKLNKPIIKKNIHRHIMNQPFVKIIDPLEEEMYQKNRKNVAE